MAEREQQIVDLLVGLVGEVEAKKVTEVVLSPRSIAVASLVSMDSNGPVYKTVTFPLGPLPFPTPEVCTECGFPFDEAHGMTHRHIETHHDGENWRLGPQQTPEPATGTPAEGE